MGVAHPISRNFKTPFLDIPSMKVAISASRERPASPLYCMGVPERVLQGAGYVFFVYGVAENKYSPEISTPPVLISLEINAYLGKKYS